MRHDGGMNSRLARLPALLTCALLLTLALGAASQSWAQGRTVATTTVEGAITPVVADHLTDLVERTAREGHEALLVELDTPGGLVTSMRDIVGAFLNADVPVIVYVSPRGADAGSAGTFITLAAHVAAMAPATTIGAATPVDLEGGEVGDKIVENAVAFAEAIAEERGRDVDFAVSAVREGRSITANEAVDIGAVDLIADGIPQLLDEIDGMTIDVNGDEVTLATAGAETRALEMSGVRRLLQTIADPNLAFIFLSLGTLAIIYEVANPGLGAGGILGAVLLILAFFALSVLPFTYAGIALLVLAGGLFLAELFMPGVGVAAAGGTVALILGGLLLFQEPTGLGVDLWILWPTALVLFGMVILAGWLVARSRGGESVAASDALIGREATIRRPDPEHPPRVVLDGTYWRVRPGDGGTEPLNDGDEVVVVDRDNIDLIVERSNITINHDSEEPA